MTSRSPSRTTRDFGVRSLSLLAIFPNLFRRRAPAFTKPTAYLGKRPIM